MSLLERYGQGRFLTQFTIDRYFYFENNGCTFKTSILICISDEESQILKESVHVLEKERFISLTKKF